MVRFPGEFEKHNATLMIWPVRPGSWGKDPSAAQKAFISIFEAILQSEDLYVLFNNDEPQKTIDDLSSRFSGLPYRFIPLRIDSNDSWARDVGPTFVLNDDEIMGIDWRFNAWGGDYNGLYQDYDLDNKVASVFCDKIGKKSIDRQDFILEGGSIATDGEGTLMVTETCLLSPGRNSSLSREKIEEYLCNALGAHKVLWLPCGIFNDETDEHVDNVAAFAGPAKIVLAWTDNIDDPQYKMSKACYDYLSSVTDCKGRKIEIIKLPIPDSPVLIEKADMDNLVFEEGEDNREEGERLAASYVNYYYTNDSILIPQFGGKNTESDKRAVEIMKSVSNGRKVVPIYARDILVGGGNIHCITQQIPETKKEG